ncbi:CatB-related O-acetyltransferase [Niabella aurantiaca]|uniref:CatB-related O-acetyltransferase n=1 Tax=Niabella aurantiaca TaxID=379900 RepID=UPI00039EBCF2
MDLILNFFSLHSIYIRLLNRKISLLSLFDRYSKISVNALINRFVKLRKCTVDSYTYIGANTTLYNVKVGKFCSISENVRMGLGTHPTNFFSTSPIFFSKKNGTGLQWRTDNIYDDEAKASEIGNDVWIGANVSIMGGIKIGNGAIIGAHSLVTKDVEPYAIVGGVPAKLIKKRFDERTIFELESLDIWNQHEEVYKKNINLFGSPVTNAKILELRSIIENNENQK